MVRLRARLPCCSDLTCNCTHARIAPAPVRTDSHRPSAIAGMLNNASAVLLLGHSVEETQGILQPHVLCGIKQHAVVMSLYVHRNLWRAQPLYKLVQTCAGHVLASPWRDGDDVTATNLTRPWARAHLRMLMCGTGPTDGAVCKSHVMCTPSKLQRSRHRRATNASNTLNHITPYCA